MIGELKPYPARKDSGVEWLGEVPAHWDVYRMSSGGWVVQPECAAACTRRRTDLGSSHDQAGNWTGFSWRSRSGRWRRRAVDGSSCHKQYWILPGGISVWAEARGVAGSIERDHGLQPGEHRRGCRLHSAPQLSPLDSGTSCGARYRMAACDTK